MTDLQAFITDMAKAHDGKSTIVIEPGSKNEGVSDSIKGVYVAVRRGLGPFRTYFIGQYDGHSQCVIIDANEDTKS